MRYKARNIASRASDFYNRTAPMLERTKPLWKPMVQNAVKSRPKLDRAVKLLMRFRRKNKRPTMTQPGKPATAMEYVNTPSEGNSSSYFTRKALKLRGLKRRVMRTMPIQLQKSEIVNSVSWPYGTQGVVSIIHNSAEELTSIAQLIPGNTLTTQMLLQRTNVHYMMTNGAKAAAKLRIYEGCFKSDLTSAFTPTTLWQNGMVDTGSSELINSIDSKPFASIGFMRHAHITKVTNVFIPQGRTHEHYCDYRYNKIYNREDRNLSGNSFLKGWTRFTMFVAYGEPVADSDTDISTGSGRLLIIATKTQRYRYNNPTSYVSNYVKSIPTTGLSVERLLDEGSGDVESNVTV
jgi:hypothetical protein